MLCAQHAEALSCGAMVVQVLSWWEFIGSALAMFHTQAACARWTHARHEGSAWLTVWKHAQVFDDWKAHVSVAREMGASDARLPRLSTVTLAFLEACCRAQPAFEWRVYDVCAAMRQQRERSSEAALARPRKASHHFLDERPKKSA